MIADIERHGMTYKAEISRFNTEPLPNEVLQAFHRHDRALASIGLKEVSYTTDQTEVQPRHGFVINASLNGQSEDKQKVIVMLLKEVAATMSKPGEKYEVTTGNSPTRKLYASIRPAPLLNHQAA